MSGPAPPERLSECGEQAELGTTPLAWGVHHLRPGRVVQGESAVVSAGYSHMWKFTHLQTSRVGTRDSSCCTEPKPPGDEVDEAAWILALRGVGVLPPLPPTWLPGTCVWGGEGGSELQGLPWDCGPGQLYPARPSCLLPCTYGTIQIKIKKNAISYILLFTAAAQLPGAPCCSATTSACSSLADLVLGGGGGAVFQISHCPIWSPYLKVTCKKNLRHLWSLCIGNIGTQLGQAKSPSK